MTTAELAGLQEAVRQGIVAGLSPLVAELRAIAAVFAAPDEPPPTDCLHPSEQRLDFGVTAGVEDWQCGACGYRSVAEGRPQ